MQKHSRKRSDPRAKWAPGIAKKAKQDSAKHKDHAKVMSRSSPLWPSCVVPASGCAEPKGGCGFQTTVIARSDGLFVPITAPTERLSTEALPFTSTAAHWQTYRHRKKLAICGFQIAFRDPLTAAIVTVNPYGIKPSATQALPQGSAETRARRVSKLGFWRVTRKWARFTANNIHTITRTGNFKDHCRQSSPVVGVERRLNDVRLLHEKFSNFFANELLATLLPRRPSELSKRQNPSFSDIFSPNTTSNLQTRQSSAITVSKTNAR
jgi:hypothetical protein